MSTDVKAILLVAGFIALLAVLAWVGDRLEDRSVELPERIDRHLTADEMALTGDDYRAKVKGFLARCQRRHRELLIRDARTAYAIDHACFPNKNEGRTASPADPHAIHGGNHEPQHP